MTGFSFGDHGMEGDLAQQALEMAAALQRVLSDVYASHAGEPGEHVTAELSRQLTEAGVPLDQDELRGYAETISDGRIAPAAT